jgi:hypothetical protein
LVDSKIPPYRLAEVAHAIGIWFNDAVLNWERNGPGSAFGVRIEELQYPRLFSENNKYGWFSSPEEKFKLLVEYRQSLHDGNFINYSRPAIKECLDYMHVGDGKVEHAPSKDVDDPTLSGENHGDRVIADAVAWKAMKDVSPLEEESDEDDYPPNCLKARMEEAKRKQNQPDYY